MKLTILLSLVLGAHVAGGPTEKLVHSKPNQKFAVVKTDAQWEKALGKEAFTILRKEGTEDAYSGKFWDNHEVGDYYCAGCNLKVFSSKAKFDSQTGWPSFYKEVAPGRTLVRVDNSLGEPRTEVICARCGGHLGHVFEDGPEPTGLRYCLNSPALKFVKAK